MSKESRMPMSHYSRENATHLIDCMLNDLEHMMLDYCKQTTKEKSIPSVIAYQEIKKNMEKLKESFNETH